MPGLEIALWPVLLILFYGFTLSGSFSLGKLVAVGLVGVWLALGKVRARESWAVGLYLLAVVLTTVFSVDRQISYWGLQGTLNTGLLCALLCVPFWLCVGVEDRGALFRGLRLGSALMSVVGILQSVGCRWVTPFNIPDYNRVYSTIGSPVYVGAVGVMILPLLEEWWEFALLGALLFLTGSRAAWIAGAVGMGYKLWPRITQRQRLAGEVGALLGVIGLLLVSRHRQDADLGRVVTWQAALDAFRLRPWLGWGAGNFIMTAYLLRNPAWDEAFGVTTQDHAHNLFLEAASTSGLVGIIAIAILLCHLWQASDRTVRASLLGVFLIGLFDPLPLIAKALCVSLVAVCIPAPQEQSWLKSNFVKGLACTSFMSVCLIVHWDRLMTFYGDVPWGFSAIEAAKHSGLIKVIPTRTAFKF